MTSSLTRRRFVSGAAAGATAMTLGLSSGATLASPAAADDVGKAARALLAVMSGDNRARTVLGADDERRTAWHYTPRRRPGARLDQLNTTERQALWSLLGSVLSPRGIQQLEGVIKLERVLGELTNNLSYRDPENYLIVMFGDPAKADPFAWRFEGHHLSLTVVVAPGTGISVTPAFFGANPATVPQRHRHNGFRLLGTEEDAAFGLVRSLEGDVRAAAIIGDRSLGDIVAGPGREDALNRFEGVPLGRLSAGQSDEIYRILALFAGTMRDDVAKAALERVRSDGANALHFAWAGSLTAGRPHYFRIHGPSVLVEYDNTQSGANHVHAVWVDPIDVFGRDLLKRHVKADH
ncbi:MAG: DUF3500 domain-containing protein [Pseudomonadota bacterium]